MSEFKPIQINVDEVLRTRATRHYKFIPRWAIRKLERTIHQDELNQILCNMGTKTGVEAADSALHDLEVSTTLIGTENIPAEGRFIFVSNHPLGGLDGMALMSAVGHRYGGNIRFIVNDLLMAVKPLRPILLPVNKHGRQAREVASLIEQEYQGDNQMITFPAGLCSRMGKKGVIHDLEWKKFIVTQAVKSKRDLIPIYFDAQNSKFFYRMAKWRKRLGIKFNFEMIYLPGEMFKCKGSNFKVYFGRPIPWTSLDASHAVAEAQRICDITYGLKPVETQK